MGEKQPCTAGPFCSLSTRDSIDRYRSSLTVAVAPSHAPSFSFVCCVPPAGIVRAPKRIVQYTVCPPPPSSTPSRVHALVRPRLVFRVLGARLRPHVLDGAAIRAVARLGHLCGGGHQRGVGSRDEDRDAANETVCAPSRLARHHHHHHHQRSRADALYSHFVVLLGGLVRLELGRVRPPRCVAPSRCAQRGPGRRRQRRCA